MPESQHRSNWLTKFANAIRGVVVGVRGQNSFLVHLPAAIAVAVLAWIFQLDAARCGLLMLCIAAVLAAELFNSSIEAMAKSITRENDPSIRDALDIASGAVLVVAAFAAAVGLLLFCSN